MNTKQWMPVKGYEDFYEIDISGIIRSLHKKNLNKVLSTRVDRCGYLTVRLSSGGTAKTAFVHRLIAESYVANPANKPYINHINGVKTDNSISNLEWVTHSENMKHAYKAGLSSIPVRCKKIVDSCTGIIFSSIKEAASYLNLNYSTCKNMLRGIRTNTTCLKYAA